MRQRTIHTPTTQRVRIGLGTVENLLGADIGCPYIGIRQEETLLGRESVTGLQTLCRRFGRLVLLEGLERNLQSAVVGNVLTQSEFTVAKHTRSHLDMAEIVGHDLGACVEVLLVLCRPPIVQVAVLVVLAALVVEAVRHLVSDNDTDGAIVERIVRRHIEERILQNTCGEANLVAGGVVVGIDGLRRHVPLGFIYGLAKVAEAVVLRKLGHTLQVLIIRNGCADVQVGIVAPCIGVADLDGDGIQLLDSTRFGGVGHPSERLDTLAQGVLQVLDKRQHALLVLLGEVLLDIHLADCFAHGAVDDTDGTLPKRTRLLTTGEHLAVEIEVFVVNLGGQVAGCAIEGLPQEQGLDVLEALLGEQLACLLQVANLPYAEAVGLNFHCGKIGCPIHLRNQLLQVGDTHLIIIGLRVAQLNIVERCACQAGLEAKHGGSTVGGIGITEEAEDVGNMLLILLADVGRCLVGIEVVLLLAERKAALILVEDIHCRIHGVGIDIHAPNTILERLAEQRAQLGTIGNSFDFIDGFAQRLDALQVASGGVHRLIVEVTDFLLDSSFGVLLGCDVLNQAVDLLEVLQR